MRSTPITRRALLAALPAGLAAPALAQPVTRDVRWIVGFAAGGSVDAMARIVAAAIGGGSIWWRLRRARQQGRPVSFVVIRR
jgi:tripartite-type tricarboxylate transporter receptor subunit TctC